MARTSAAETRHRSLYLDIRRNLMLGAFPSGHRFKVNDLCVEYDASVSVVREALTRLSEQGLVHLEPNKGFSVATLTPDEVNDVAFLRIELETLAVRRSIERGGADWEVGVVAAHHHLTITPNVAIDEDPEGNQRWTLAHQAFHEACAAACGSPRLLSFRAQLYDQSEVFRQLAKLRHGRSRNVAAEHQAIADAVVSRNGALATALLHDHIDATRISCLDSLAGSEPSPVRGT
jgi:DNA-binding GntR family transcriptional regulator